MNVLDLFSGIGGFSLGLERAGMRTVAFCEIEPFARRVLAKHWPNVPCYDDVRNLTADRLASDGIAVDVICGGFPCQDISFAGKQIGLDGARSGLWSEIARLTSELRPSFVIVENVSALLSNGMGRVLGDLASIGYDAEWHCIPASYLGAPHRRDRVWIVANASSDRWAQCWARDEGRNNPAPRRHDKPGRNDTSDGTGTFADTDCFAPIGASIAREERRCWSVEPDVGRVAYGIPNRVDRLKGLGNAVVPQIPELIGRAIMSTKREL